MTEASGTDNFSLPFDRYQSHRLAADVLGRLREPGATLRVLEVGDGLMRSFLTGDEVVILDVAHEQSGSLRGDATDLPFEDSSFDYAVSLDACERIEPAARARHVSELRRVVGRGVLLASPFDSPGVREAEELANEAHRALCGEDHERLAGRRARGLPDLNDTRDLFEEAGDSVTELPNGYLPNWLMMTCRHFYGRTQRNELRRLSGQATLFYNRHLYPYDNAEPCYRYLVVALQGDAPEGLEELVSPPVDARRAELSASLAGTLAATLPLGAELRRSRAELARREAQAQDLSERLARQVSVASSQQGLRQENEQLRRERERLRKQLTAMTNSRSWRVVWALARLRNGLKRRLRGG